MPGFKKATETSRTDQECPGERAQAVQNMIAPAQRTTKIAAAFTIESSDKSSLRVTSADSLSVLTNSSPVVVAAEMVSGLACTAVLTL